MTGEILAFALGLNLGVLMLAVFQLGRRAS